MYTLIDGNLAISVNDWEAAGLTYRQFCHDSHKGHLKIVRRGINGNTWIAVDSIQRPDRMAAIEAAYGKVKKDVTDTYALRIDTNARAFFTNYVREDGTPLDAEKVLEYTNRASLFTTLKRGLDTQIAARAKAGTRVKMGEWYATALQWHTQKCTDRDSLCHGVKPYSNVRSFERAFKSYLNSGYTALLHKNIGSENARKVSRSLENLLLSIWRNNDKPFVARVHELYLEFISGTTEIWDKSTGEVFQPQDFLMDGKAPEISVGTVWNYLKDVVNNTAVYADRNGNFDYANSRRPKQHRKLGQYSLSKISMDDVALSRRSTRGWVYKYIAVDVVSGYYFRPAYVVGKPSESTVYESFRNMFCELVDLGLPMPGELEVEHHLMANIPWLNDAFSFVRFCQSPTEKRAEHNIKSLKWGTAKKMGHTRGRWYAKHEAYRAVRNKVSGDFVEQVEQPQNIVADDLSDIERHNNELHPLQKKYPGMTRRDVLLKNFNPQLQPIDASYLLQFIGNMTDTSIRNNDYVACCNGEYELVDFRSLKRLRPNNNEVTAYWLPNDQGSIERVYLYQGEVYIGEAVSREASAYNECAVERTDADREAMLHQNKRLAKFDKFIKERREELSKVGQQDTEVAAAIANVPVDIVIEENEQPLGYEEDEFNCDDYIKNAINNL